MTIENESNPRKSVPLNLSLELIELSTVLVVPDFTPTTINLNFLNYSGIIPDDWKQTANPIVNNFQVKFFFNNKAEINLENNRIIFSEVLDKQAKPQIPSISLRFIEVLNKADYQALGFNSKYLVIFKKDEDIARRYITEKLLRVGSWYKASKSPIRANISYFYTLEDSQLNLNVSEATFQVPEQPVQSAILFTSNFHYNLKGETILEKQKYLLQILGNWESIVKENKQIISAFLN